MAPLAIPIKEVDRSNKPCLKFRVLHRFYRLTSDNNRSLEMILHDNEGGRITGIIKSQNLDLLDNRFVQGHVYAIKNYYVENDIGRFLTNHSKFRIVLHSTTCLIEITKESFFPDLMFDFRSYSTFVDPDRVDDTKLFDIIGKVTEIHPPQEKLFVGRRTRFIQIVLEDFSGQRANPTLWANYVDEILAFERNNRAGPRVLILQLCRAKVYRDKVTITNSFNITQIHYLESIPAIEMFKSHAAAVG
ncbi:hypothetical protein CASFOL_022719 [Castilleja foliolosa]|uniref:Replication protein A 70 kDa DNA-binding subunit B/D first OB fold domain-containing protein n=1 Tax=Castilleja foliolosa TaxID=1961234 RepID=A0ABD3CWA5_9LAMI